MADVDFDEFPQGVNTPAPQGGPQDVDFNEFPQGMRDSSMLGSAARGLAEGAAPALGGLAGAEAAAPVGAALGEALFPAGGGLVGGIAGGLVGAFGGGAAVQKGQDWLISKLPQSWQDEYHEQQQADTTQYPKSAFLGGVAPYALTGSFSPSVAVLPENATTWQKIMASPMTQRIFSGAINGGTELGSEYVNGDAPDWAKAIISTGVGAFLPGQSKLGETILGPARIAGQMAARRVGEAIRPATLAEAADAKVMGPGITEDVYQGVEKQNHQAEMQAQQVARDEKMALEGPPKPDVATVARGYAPDLFYAYDAAQERLDALKTSEVPAPPERLAEAQAHVDALAPQVAQAYRTAAESIGTDVIHPEAEMVSPNLTPSAPEAAATTGEAQPPEAPPLSPQREADSQYIVEDVKHELERAGITGPQAESRAVLEAAFFDTLAANTNFKAGSAKDLYNQHGPTWKRRAAPAERPNALELTQEPVRTHETNASWVIRNKETKEVIMETFDKAKVDALNTDKYEALPIQQYMGDLQDRINKGELYQGAKGKIRLTPGKRPLISLFKDADISTLIHEGAHNYLDVLSQYADHPEASPQLKSDFQAIKDWAGIKGDTISTRAHEKFARGFEQYTREGVAPSPRLARAFAQFKQWMTSIYQTLRGLGQPINNDIRGVFDRMLAENPQPTVIAEAGERGPTLSDIHEADAELVHPKDAEAIGDQIVGDRERALAEHHPNVQAEIQNAVAIREAAATEAAEPTGESGAGSVGPSSMVNAGGGPESESGGGARGETGGPLQRSGEQGVPEGAKLEPTQSGGAGAESERGSNAGESARNGMVPTNVERLESRRPTDLTDKAGNIRLENLTNDEDARAAIRQSAAENNDFLGDRRGIVTDQQVDDLADALGMTQTTLLKRRIGQAFNAEQIIAARKLLIQSATHVSDLMKKAANGTDADLMAYAEAKARHQMIQGAVSGITAEAGRALRAFRNIAGQEQAMQVDQFLKDATGKTLFQLKEEAKLGSALGTPEQVSAFLDKAGKPTFGKMALEFWINNILSAASTHITYSVGNLILAGERIAETAAQAGFSTIRGREGENVTPFGAARAKLQGLVKGLPSAAEAAGQAARTGTTTLLPGEVPKGHFALQYGGALKQDATWGDAGRAWYGVGRGLKDAVIAAGQIVKAAEDPKAPFASAVPTRGYIPSFKIGKGYLPTGELFGQSSGRMIATIHSFFRALNYSIEANGGEFTKAWNEGHRGDALASRIADLRLNRSEADMEKWRGEATEATLMSAGGEFTKKLSAFFNNEVNLGPLGPTPLLKFIDPFVHISSNIINQAIVQRTPIGILAPSIRNDLLGRNGQVAADKAAARMLVGSTLAMTFGYLAAEGYVTGSGPADRNKAAMWRQAGYQAHSVKINDTWYDLHRLGPMGMLLGMAADLYDLAGVAEKEDVATTAAAFQHAITQSVLDESFMRGPSEALKAIEDKSYAPIYLRNLASGFVPWSSLGGSFARATDPYQRQTRSMIDALRQRVPGQSELLQPRVDTWGQLMPQGEALGGPALSAVYMSRQSHDPVNAEMVRLGVGKPPVERKIRNQTLTDPEYTEFAQIAGKMTKSTLDGLVNSPRWYGVPDSSKVHIIDEVFKRSREGAAHIMMARHPDIVNGAFQMKRDRASGKNIHSLQ